VSQVENLARAGITYRYLRPFGLKSETRKRLTPSHFSTMGDLWRWLDLSPYDVIEALDLAAEGGMSVAAMQAEVRAVHGHYRPWVDRYDSLRKKIYDLAMDYETPGAVRLVLKAVIKRLDSVI